MRSVTFSPEADNDLNEIETFSARMWGEARTAAYIRALFAAVDRIADSSARGKPHSGDADGFWLFTSGSHVIVYREFADDNRLEVVNILHRSMDIAARLAATRRNF